MGMVYSAKGPERDVAGLSWRPSLTLVQEEKLQDRCFLSCSPSLPLLEAGGDSPVVTARSAAASAVMGDSPQPARHCDLLATGLVAEPCTTGDRSS